MEDYMKCKLCGTNKDVLKNGFCKQCDLEMASNGIFNTSKPVSLSLFIIVLLHGIVASFCVLVLYKSMDKFNNLHTCNYTPKQQIMRITGYTPTGNKTALGEKMVVGRTAAVSPNCIYLLGEKVYIRGHGVRYVNDVTASWLDEEFGICTLDLAVPNEQEALRVGNETKQVVRIP